MDGARRSPRPVATTRQNCRTSTGATQASLRCGTSTVQRRRPDDRRCRNVSGKMHHATAALGDYGSTGRDGRVKRAVGDPEYVQVEEPLIRQLEKMGWTHLAGA